LLLAPVIRRALWNVACALVVACGVGSIPGSARADVVPAHDRVIVVVMENKSYDVARIQPYTMSLQAQGARFSNSFATSHPSQPNYFSLFAGWDLSVSSDACPAPGSPYSYENLGHALEAQGRTWRAYSENLAAVGSTACSYDGTASTGLYVRKHEPWTYFSNLNHTNERPYSDLAADIAANALPNLVYVIPNNCHNTHNSSTPGCSTADGDTWLSNNLPPLIAALGPNGLLILTWDEDDSASGNHILTVFVGPKVQPGFVSNIPVSHYTMMRTISDAFGLAPFNQARFETPITNVWITPVPSRPTSWGLIKATYR
jgi:hypothetical protein